jgi:hypothetical protein
MNSFYFLHIPKTAGHYIENRIVYPIEGYLLSKNIKIHKGHQYWYPVNNETYVISSFRDPIKRTISMFSHYRKYIDSVDNNRDNLMLWIEKNQKYLSNFQSKSLIYNNAPKKDWYLIENEDFINLEIDSKILEKNIKKIQIFIKVENLDNNSILKIRKKILQDFNCNITDKINEKMKIGNKLKDNVNLESLDLYSKITDFDKKYIEDLNIIDYKIYNSEIFF